jgi:hypothetical protein
MEKIILTLSFCLCLSSAFAGAGIGVKYGTGPADSNITSVLSDSLEEGKSFYGLEFFMEKDAEKDALGLRIGFHKYGDIKASGSYFDFGLGYDVHENLKNEFYTIPLTLYYKRKITPAVHLSFGGGVTWAYSKWSYDSNGNGVTGETMNDNKFFPHIDLGAEWRVSNHIGIGVDLTYNSKSKVDSENLYRGVEGVTGNIVARWYF